MSLYQEIFYSTQVTELFSERNTIAQMLCFETALAKAQASHGIIPATSAEIIADRCDAGLVDMQRLKKEIQLSGNAAIPLVKQLTQIVKNTDGEASKYVHFGATSQDVIDTAAVLQIRDFIAWAETQLTLLVNELRAITKKHRRTLMVGRTLLQQARPITFGLKTAGWLESVSRSKERIAEVKKRVLTVQLAGAAGSQNRQITNAVKHTVARILGLDAAHSWHTHRDNLAEFASILGILTGSLAKIAKDIVLLMQTEVGEVFEGAGEGKGGSSTMPHKRNPVTSTAILANAARVPSLVATMLSVMPQEHERSAGPWHAEWEVLSEIAMLAAGTIERAIELAAGLEVDEKRMLQNLEMTRGLIYAENVSLALTPAMGKSNAHAFVEKACKTALARHKHLKEVLLDLRIGLRPDQLDELFEPENSIGLSLEVIDEILSKYEDQL